MAFMRLRHLTLATTLALGCLVGGMSPASAQQGEIVIRVAPPAPRAEVRGSYRAGYEWVPGHWRWDGDRYGWVSGHWERARAGYSWQPARWERRYDGWVFIPGRWVRVGRPAPAPPPPVYDGRPRHDGPYDGRPRYDGPYDGRPRHDRPYDGRYGRPGYGRPDWGRQGWVLLGEKWVTGSEDHDFIPVGRREGRFRQLLVSSDEGDFLMRRMIIDFTDGRAWSPTLRQYFREGSRSRVLNIPNAPRGLRSIRFTYGEMRGGGGTLGRARVQVWGR